MRSLKWYLSGWILMLAGLPWAQADDWSQFRGPNCQGVSTEKKPLPVEFSATNQARWSAVVGEGVGSPVVASGRVFTTAMTPEGAGSRQLRVFAFDAATGKELWRKDLDAGPRPFAPIHPVSSYASATPLADAERVYVYFVRTGLTALDARTGAKVWNLPLPEPFFIFDWGPGMSPVLHRDTIYFCQDDDLFPTLYAIDARTGKVRWKDDRSDMSVSYSHPVICETAKGPELVVAGTGKLLGYDPATGRRKWAAELNCRNIKTTPLCHDGVIYVSVQSYGMSYQWRATADANGDGKITREEIKASRKDKGAGIPEAFWKKFERGDRNKDGVLEGEEIDLAFLDPSNKGGILDREARRRAGDNSDWRKWDADLQSDSSIQAVRAGGSGDVTKTHVLWKVKTKTPDHLVSPLLVDGRLLLPKSGGFLSCFDARKGTPLYESQRLGVTTQFLAQPVAGDGKIYLTGQTGRVIVLANEPRLKVLARNDLGEDCIGTPAIAGGRLFFRTRTKLICIGSD